MDNGKDLFSKDTEGRVLGSMINRFDTVNLGIDVLDESDFAFVEHKLVFKVIKLLYKEDKTADSFLISEELHRQGKLELVGGYGFVPSLCSMAGLDCDFETYIALLKHYSTLRKIICALDTIRNTTLSKPRSCEEVLDNAQQLFFQISQQTSSSNAVHIRDILNGKKSKSGKSFSEEIQDQQERFRLLGPNASLPTGINSGFIDLDKILLGLGNSNLILLAASPGMGKTTLAMNIVEEVCFKQNQPVGIFSLEMGADQLVHRVLCSQAEVSSEKIKSGTITGLEYQRIIETGNKLFNCPLIIDDQPSIKITDLRVRARRLKEAYGIKLLVIDYLQLIYGTGSFKNENKQTEISDISRMLKNLARELDIPVLCLSQLSRKVAERPGNRPVMSDLRDSGSLEQDADVVLLLFRPEYYEPNSHPGRTELIIAKNRHGKVGNVKLIFAKEFTKFRNYAFEPIFPNQFPGD